MRKEIWNQRQNNKKNNKDPAKKLYRERKRGRQGNTMEEQKLKEMGRDRKGGVETDAQREGVRQKTHRRRK